jgi:hypothetical protein
VAVHEETMAAICAHVRLAILAPLLVAAGCAGAGRAPCVHCDGGKTDAPTGQAMDLPSSEAALHAETATEAFVPAEAADVRLPATRDTPGSEARPGTPIPDGGWLWVEDFESEENPNWEALDVRNASSTSGEWSVVRGDFGSLFTQGVLDTTTWHIAYATADLGPDQIIEARLRVVDFFAETPSYMVALFGRYDPATDSGYFVALRADGSVTLRKRERGANASWGGGVAGGIRRGVWYTVRLEIIGDALTAFIDGVEVYAVTDDEPLSQGHIALGAFGATLEVDRVLAGAPE